MGFGPWSPCHPGDCVPYEDQVERLRPFAVDLALLPINGRAPERRVPGNFTGPEAAPLAHAIGARLAVPCHYDMFEFNTASPAPFRDECARLGQALSRAPLRPAVLERLAAPTMRGDTTTGRGGPDREAPIRPAAPA